MDNPETSHVRLASVRLPSWGKGMEERSTSWPLLLMYYRPWFTFYANMHCFSLVTNESDKHFQCLMFLLFLFLNKYISPTGLPYIFCNLRKYNLYSVRQKSIKKCNFLIYMRRLSFNCFETKPGFTTISFSITSEKEKE